METVTISDLRANLLDYMKKAGRGHEIIVTSHGEILATITPASDKTLHARARLKALAKRGTVRDVVSPIHDSWDAAT